MGAPQPLVRGGSSRGCGGCPAPRAGCSHGDCHEEEESDSGNLQPEPAGEGRGPSGNVERDQDAPDRAADLSAGSHGALHGPELPLPIPHSIPTKLRWLGRARGGGREQWLCHRGDTEQKEDGAVSQPEPAGPCSCRQQKNHPEAGPVNGNQTTVLRNNVNNKVFFQEDTCLWLVCNAKPGE